MLNKKLSNRGGGTEPWPKQQNRRTNSTQIQAKIEARKRINQKQWSMSSQPNQDKVRTKDMESSSINGVEPESRKQRYQIRSPIWRNSKFQIKTWRSCIKLKQLMILTLKLNLKQCKLERKKLNQWMLEMEPGAGDKRWFSDVGWARMMV